jgi:hypothetical protein
MPPSTQLASLRLAIGVGAWAAPDVTGKLFGLDPAGNPQASYLGRLFAVRDLALGVGTLASDTSARKLWLQLGVVCDVADAAAAVLTHRRGVLPTWATALLTGVALSAAATGVLALRED